jgi:hypothetical protein
MSTSQQYFGQWKKESRIIVLNKRYAKCYYDSVRFRERIQRSIINSRLQLELLFTFEGSSHPTEINLQLFTNVRRIAISVKDDMFYIITPNVLDVDTVEFVSCHPEISSCSRVKSLKLSPHWAINEGATFDLAPLISLENGRFNIYRCVNYQSLANLKWLERINCRCQLL